MTNKKHKQTPHKNSNLKRKAISNKLEDTRMNNEASNISRSEELVITCHCKRVRAKFICKSKVVAWECNCSDCSMRGNVHIIVPKEDLRITMPDDNRESLEDATTLYEWGTKTASRRFCKTCGILPFYKPRSNPDGVAITLKCIDWSSTSFKPTVELQKFDGINWEESFNASKITEQT